MTPSFRLGVVVLAPIAALLCLWPGPPVLHPPSQRPSPAGSSSGHEPGRPRPLPLHEPAAAAMPAPLAQPAQRSAAEAGVAGPEAAGGDSFQRALQQARYTAWPVTGDAVALPENRGVRYFAANAAQDFTARFLADGGVRFESGRTGGAWQGTLRRTDRAGDHEVVWRTRDARTEATRGGITEWYENRPEGLEQGFIVSSRPAETPAGAPLALRLQLEGLRTEGDPARPGSLMFVDPRSGLPVLGYRELKVWDAAGQALAAELQPAGAGFRIAIDDRSARYPITIDPLVVTYEQRIDPGLDPYPSSLSLDGDTLVIGQDQENGSAGAVYIFSRAGGSWAPQTKLRSPQGLIYDGFGTAVKVRANTLVVGAPRSGANQGRVDIFVRSGSTWTLQQQLTVANSYSFGDLLAMDGPDTLLVHENTGVAARYLRSGTTWSVDHRFELPFATLQGYPLTSLAIEGTRVALGAAYTDEFRGAVFTFQKPGADWVGPVKLQAAEGVAGDRFGAALGLSSASGITTLVVGAPERDAPGGIADAGKVYPYDLLGGIWTPQPPLDTPEPAAGRWLGYGISLAGDALCVNTFASSPYFYRRSGGVWGPAILVYSEVGRGTSVAADLDSGGGRLAMANYGNVRTFIPAAETVTPESVLPFVTGGANDHFGLHLDIDGATAIVGALDEDTPAGANAGAAYVFRRVANSWNLEARLVDPAGAANDRFGVAVGVSGDTVVVGSDFDDEGSVADNGSASVFVRGSGGGWARQGGKLVPATGAPWSAGRAVAIDGDTIVIGLPNANSGTGLIATYRRSGGVWNPGGSTGSLTPQSGAIFGFSLALQGNRLIVGEPLWDFYSGTIPVAPDTGRVTIFARTGPTAAWVKQTELVLPSAGSRLGFSVALDGDTMAAGASFGPQAWTGGGTTTNPQGFAVTARYSGSAWSGLSVLPSEGTAAGSYLGCSVAVDGGIIAVGAFGNETLAGKVVLFQRGSSWTRLTELAAPYSGTPESDNAFGIAVALDGGSLLVGSYGANSPVGADGGLVHHFHLDDLAALSSQLHIELSADRKSVLLSWPAGAGFDLAYSTTLAENSWSVLTSARDDPEGIRTYTWTIGSRRKAFFRLQKD